MTSLSLRSRAEAPATSSFEMELSAIRNVRIRTWSRARMAAVRSVRSRSLSSATSLS